MLPAAFYCDIIRFCSYLYWLDSKIYAGGVNMRVLRSLFKNKNALFPALCIVALGFLYGCQCEGGIGTSARDAGPGDTIVVAPGK